MGTQIFLHGGAATVEIPEELLKLANLAVGDPVEWTLTSGGTLALKTSGNLELAAGRVEDGYEEWKMQQMEAGFAAIDAGQSVDDVKVREWLQSWGMERELPPPL